MKYLKFLIPISILFLIFIIDHYNKYYKPNTSFDDESIMLVMNIKICKESVKKIHELMMWK